MKRFRDYIKSIFANPCVEETPVEAPRKRGGANKGKKLYRFPDGYRCFAANELEADDKYMRHRRENGNA